MPNDTIATEDAGQALRAAITAQLSAAGWTPLAGTTAIALKTYQTAVGPKDAHAYIADFGPNEPNYVLRGEYYSEGSNVLSADGVLIPKDADPATATALVEQFAAGAEKSVLDSYAARLHLRWGGQVGGGDDREGEEEGEAASPSM
jgi:hypothetical protein